jgi:UDP-N-acetylglucosamine--dolichyl-phosphate N-acetylglucosaminephosphotransferase
MPGTVEVVAISLLIAAVILGRVEAIYLLLPFIGTMGAYYLFNRYPAKVFSGDVGSLAVGAALVTIALVSRLEIVLLMAMIPFIVNGLNTLLSAGFRERREMKARPTYLTPDGKIAANPDPAAPVPLANLFLLDGPKTEKEMTRMYLYTVALSAVLGIITALIMLGGGYP